MSGNSGVLRIFWYAILLTLVSGAYAQQPFTGGTRVVVETDRLRVRSSPGLASDTIGTQEQGVVGTVRDPSPYYADGFWWWHIDYSSGADGWSAEGSTDERFLGQGPILHRASGTSAGAGDEARADRGLAAEARTPSENRVTFDDALFTIFPIGIALYGGFLLLVSQDRRIGVVALLAGLTITTAYWSWWRQESQDHSRAYQQLLQEVRFDAFEDATTLEEAFRRRTNAYLRFARSADPDQCGMHCTVRFVTLAGLNMRSGPGPEYGVVNTLPRNEQVAFAIGGAKEASWVLVDWDDETGWVNSDYLAYHFFNVAVDVFDIGRHVFGRPLLTVRPTLVYEQHEESSRVLQRLQTGTRVAWRGEFGHWAKVNASEGQGWVRAGDVRLEPLADSADRVIWAGTRATEYVLPEGTASANVVSLALGFAVSLILALVIRSPWFSGLDLLKFALSFYYFALQRFRYFYTASVPELVAIAGVAFVLSAAATMVSEVPVKSMRNR